MIPLQLISSGDFLVVDAREDHHERYAQVDQDECDTADGDEAAQSSCILVLTIEGHSDRRAEQVT